MNPSALPVGTQISVQGEGQSSDVLERVQGGWAATNYHCVDCAASWLYDGDALVSDGDDDSAADIGDLSAILADDEKWKVISVPAPWLIQRLTDALTGIESPEYYEAKPHKALRDLNLLADAVRSLAVDAGLS